MDEKKKAKACDCPECGKTFATRASLLTHITDIHNKDESNIFKCTVCDQSFPAPVRLRKHMQKVHNQVLNFKDLYLKRAATKVNKRRLLTSPNSQGSVVMKNAFNTPIFACQKCGFGPTDSFPEMRAHIESAEQGDGGACLLVCNECKDQRTFDKLSDLVKHVEQYHGEVWQAFRCDHCPLGFSTQSLLELHITASHVDRVKVRQFNSI